MEEEESGDKGFESGESVVKCGEGVEFLTVNCAG